MKYYEPTDVLSKQRPMNFVIGPRSYGKTTSLLNFVAKRFIKTHGEEQFAYIRRRKTELGDIVDFWGYVKQLQPDVNFKTKGGVAYINDEKAGYMLALSTAANYKSNPFAKVKWIIFDEFIPEGNSRYLSGNEPHELMGLISTIRRSREDVRAFLLANAVKLNNLYFEVFNIKNVDVDKEFNLYDNLCVNIIGKSATEFVEATKSTQWGELMMQSGYGDFAINNSFKDNTTTLIRERSKHAIPIALIKYLDSTFGVWYDSSIKTVYIDEKFDPNVRIKLAITQEDLDESFSYRKGVDRLFLNTLVKARDNNLLYFSDTRIRELAFEFLKLIGIY